jgi:hypothetical protein
MRLWGSFWLVENVLRVLAFFGEKGVFSWERGWREGRECRVVTWFSQEDKATALG